jgi:GT2 family glycosyltransferase
MGHAMLTLEVAERELRERVTIVLLTYNCVHRLKPILMHLSALNVAIVAVDNGSSDNTMNLLHSFEQIKVIGLSRNIGAAARNVGLEHTATPYVAFCDDDGWYERDGLGHATDALDAHPALALVNGRILVGEQQRLDPISAEMADSPLPERHGIPGAVLLGFMAGACIVRVDAYRAVGGYEPEFFMGGEEQTLALKLAAAGWQLRYRDDVVVYHCPSQANVNGLRPLGLRNALWTCWIYRRRVAAVTATFRLLSERRKDRAWVYGILLALRGLPWALGRRQAVSVELDEQLRVLDRHRLHFLTAHRAHRLTAH